MHFVIDFNAIFNILKSNNIFNIKFSRMKGFKKFKNFLDRKPLNSNLDEFINLQTKFYMINKKKKIDEFYTVEKQMKDKLSNFPFGFDSFLFNKE